MLFLLKGKVVFLFLALRWFVAIAGYDTCQTLTDVLKAKHSVRVPALRNVKIVLRLSALDTLPLLFDSSTPLQLILTDLLQISESRCLKRLLLTMSKRQGSKSAVAVRIVFRRKLKRPYIKHMNFRSRPRRARAKQRAYHNLSMVNIQTISITTPSPSIPICNKSEKQTRALSSERALILYKTRNILMRLPMTVDTTRLNTDSEVQHEADNYPLTHQDAQPNFA